MDGGSVQIAGPFEREWKRLPAAWRLIAAARCRCHFLGFDVRTNEPFPTPLRHLLLRATSARFLAHLAQYRVCAQTPGPGAPIFSGQDQPGRVSKGHRL